MKNKIKIIYEDNHLLVCEKPVNMPVQADSSGDEDLLSTVKAYIISGLFIGLTDP